MTYTSGRARLVWAMKQARPGPGPVLTINRNRALFADKSFVFNAHKSGSMTEVGIWSHKSKLHKNHGEILLKYDAHVAVAYSKVCTNLGTLVAVRSLPKATGLSRAKKADRAMLALPVVLESR